MSDITDRNRVPAGVTTGGQFATEPRSETDVTLGAGDPTPEEVNAIVLAAIRRRLKDSDPSTWDLHPDDAERVLAAVERAPDEVIADAVGRFRKCPPPDGSGPVVVDGYMAEFVLDATNDAVVNSWARRGDNPSWY